MSADVGGCRGIMGFMGKKVGFMGKNKIRTDSE